MSACTTEWFALRAEDHEVPCSDSAGDGFQLITVFHFIVESLHYYNCIISVWLIVERDVKYQTKGCKIPNYHSLCGSVGCTSDWWAGGRGFDPHWVRQISFVENNQEIFSAIILFLPLNQEEQLSVSNTECAQILINHLEDKACPGKVRLGKLTC